MIITFYSERNHVFGVIKMTIKRLSVTLFVLLLVSAFAFGEYNQDAVVKVMRNNGGLMRTVGQAAGQKDFFAAASGLWEIAKGMQEISVYTPPRGSKADWDKTMKDFVNAALKGIGACGEQDVAKLNAAISTLRGLNRSGHMEHK